MSRETEETQNDFLRGKRRDPRGITPWLFCDTTWLPKMEPTDVAYDEETGRTYRDGTTVGELFGEEIRNHYLYWSSDFNEDFREEKRPRDCHEGGLRGPTGRVTDAVDGEGGTSKTPVAVTFCADRIADPDGQVLGDHAGKLFPTLAD